MWVTQIPKSSYKPLIISISLFKFYIHLCNIRIMHALSLLTIRILSLRMRETDFTHETFILKIANSHDDSRWKLLWKLNLKTIAVVKPITLSLSLSETEPELAGTEKRNYIDHCVNYCKLGKRPLKTLAESAWENHTFNYKWNINNIYLYCNLYFEHYIIFIYLVNNLKK